MEDCESSCIWYVCQFCNRAFENRFEFVKHKASAHPNKKADPPSIIPSDPFLKDMDGDFKNEIKKEYDYGFDTIDSSGIFKLEPVSVNEWESDFSDGIKDILLTLKTMDDFPQTNNNNNNTIKSKKRKTTCVLCTKCDKLFSSKYTLKTHQKIHEGQKPFECEQCGKHFSQKINLKYHMRTHTGEKPHICSFCKKSFSQIANLSTHVRRCHTKPKE